MDKADGQVIRSSCRMQHGHRMTTPEQQLLRRRRQIFDDQAMDRLELDTPEREDAWVKDFIGRLAGILRHISKR
jgi:hypothetical protein